MGRTSDAKQKILGAARSLIEGRGYSALGVAEICKAAGVPATPKTAQRREDVVERAERLLAELLSVYSAAPPAVRLRIRDKVIRAFADSVDTGEDRLRVRDDALRALCAIEN